jgi:ketosteroid isomerase-like protein
MRSLILIAVCLLLVPAVSAHPPGRPLTAAEAAIARTVMTTREGIRGLVEAKDAKGLAEAYTDDFTHTHGSGKVDGRDNRIVSLLSGEPTVELAPMDELHIRVHGTATVIVSGRSPIRSMADGKTYDFRWTQVFVKTGERWQMAVSQATRLPPPAN